MSTKKEQLNVDHLQLQIDKNHKLLIDMHYKNEKLIKSNAYNIEQTIKLVNNNNRSFDKAIAQCNRFIMLAFISLGSLVVFAEFIKYVM